MRPDQKTIPDAQHGYPVFDWIRAAAHDAAGLAIQSLFPMSHILRSFFEAEVVPFLSPPGLIAAHSAFLCL